MSTSPPAEIPAAPAAGPVAAWVNFWFTPVSPVGFHALRVLACLLFLNWLLPLAGDHQALFGLDGWFDTQAYKETSHLPDLPPPLFSWSVLYLCSDPLLLRVVYWLSIAVVVLFGLGLWPRLMGVLTWVVVVSFTANPAIAYDADPLLRMLAFYLMVGYLLLGQRAPEQSLLARLLGPRGTFLFHRASPGEEGEATESVGANLGLRLFQVHFAIIMLASGLHKLQMKDWWAGLVPWYYIRPPFPPAPDPAQGHAANGGTYLAILSLTSCAMLVGQIGFSAPSGRPACPAHGRRWNRGPFRLGDAPAWLRHLCLVPLALFAPGLILSAGLAPPPALPRRLETLQVIFSLISYGVLAWQIGFPAFAWRRRWRPILLGGAVTAWLACLVLVSWPLFGPIMLIGCLSYLTPDEWRRLGNRLTWASGVR